MIMAVPKFKLKSILGKKSNCNLREKLKRIFSLKSRGSEQFSTDTDVYYSKIPLELDLSLRTRAYNMSMYRL